MVFVSYSSSDASLANSIYTYQNKHGIRALKAPEDIRPKQDWAGSIAAMIDNATHMVLIWTRGSMAISLLAIDPPVFWHCIYKS
jgi:TIR domain